MKKIIGFALISIGAAVGAHLFAAKLPEVWDGGRGRYIGGFHESEIHNESRLLGPDYVAIPTLAYLLGKSDHVTVNETVWP